MNKLLPKKVTTTIKIRPILLDRAKQQAQDLEEFDLSSLIEIALINYLEKLGNYDIREIIEEEIDNEK